MNKSENTELYHAAIGAFCMISFGDGDVHISEISRLTKIFINEDTFKNIDIQRLHTDVFDCVAMLDEDFEKGKKRIISQISKIKNDARNRDLILKIARLTLISDDRILEAEENQIADIHAALEIEEE